MPARFIPLINENYYHIFNRGVNKQNIYETEQDYLRATNLLRFYNFIDHPIRFSKFLLLSSDSRKEIWTRLSNSSTNADIISYVFMPNHFHILVKQNIDNGIAKLLADFQNSYSRYFNLRSSRSGHLFQNRFKAVKINSEEQLFHVSRYIHLNPYSSSIAKTIDELVDYKWSSLAEYRDISKFQICNKSILLTNFKNKEKYIDFVLNNANYQKTLENIKHLTFE